MAMPATIQPLWDSLNQEVIGLHAYWLTYRQLFCESEERLDLLNDCAGQFFYIVQDSLLSDLQLSLSKLSDPAETMGKKSATLQRLLDEITALNIPQLTVELTRQLEVYTDRCRGIKKRRNKELAHADLATLLQKYGYAKGTQIQGPSRQEIEDALAALRQFMISIDVHFTGIETAYEHFISRDDGDSLVLILKQGLRYQELTKTEQIPITDLKNFGRHDV
jgi:hypothetical protein